MAKEKLEKLAGTKLVRRVRGKVVAKASVQPDGRIRVGKKIYGSPSAAASSVTGHAMNGWRWWETADGKLLDELR